MFYQDFWYFFFVYFMWNKTVYENAQQAGMPLETFYELTSTFLHFSYQVESFNFAMTNAMTNFV